MKNFSALRIAYLLIISFVVFCFACDKEEAKQRFDEQFETFTDERDSNEYIIVTLGRQTWMAENLAYLPKVNKPDSFSVSNEHYYVYDYEGVNRDEAAVSQFYKSYGVLYNWAAASEACPAGWHLPSTAEWEALVSYLISNSGAHIDADSLSSSMMAPFGWNNYFSNDSITADASFRNKTLFSAVPGGYLYYDGNFYSEGNSAYWWTATDSSEINATARVLTYNINSLTQHDFNKEMGLSVRCIKN